MGQPRLRAPCPPGGVGESPPLVKRLRDDIYCYATSGLLPGLFNKYKHDYNFGFIAGLAITTRARYSPLPYAYAKHTHAVKMILYYYDMQSPRTGDSGLARPLNHLGPSASKCLFFASVPLQNIAVFSISVSSLSRISESLAALNSVSF